MAGQSGTGGRQHASLADRFLLDRLAFLMIHRAKAMPDFLSVQNGDGEKADTTAGAALATGKFADQSRPGTVKPAGGLLKKCRRPRNGIAR